MYGITGMAIIEQIINSLSQDGAHTGAVQKNVGPVLQDQRGHCKEDRDEERRLCGGAVDRIPGDWGAKNKPLVFNFQLEFL